VLKPLRLSAYAGRDEILERYFYLRFLVFRFFVCIFKTRKEHGFFVSPPEEETVNSMEQKIFCQIYVEEIHLGF
jgi:hypothetical protein